METLELTPKQQELSDKIVDKAVEIFMESDPSKVEILQAEHQLLVKQFELEKSVV